jgi:type I restriction enzyme S subunit
MKESTMIPADPEFGGGRPGSSVLGAATGELGQAGVRRFKRYPAYKHSGVEWLEEIPEHWRIKQVRHSCSKVTDGAHISPDTSSPDVPFVSTVDIRAGNIDLDSCLRTSAASYAYMERTGCRPRRGDVLFSKDGTVGTTAVVETDRVFAVASSLVILSPDVRRVDPLWLDDWLNGVFIMNAVEVLLSGAALRRISVAKVGRLPLLAPPELDEQRTITIFINRETTRIDALVAKKERLIELLEEKRTALITRAVTKGLDPNAPMRDSGVEWLGEIPAHWEVRPLKAVSELQTGLTLGKKFEGRSLLSRPYLRVANVQDGYLALDDISEVELPGHDAVRYELRNGDVVMTEGGDFDKLGRGHVWEGQIAGCLHQNHIFAVRPRRDVLRPHFLSHALSSGYGRAYFTATSKQSTNLASTNSTKLRNLPVPLPSLREQDNIVSSIDRDTGRADALVAKIREAIDRLKELRAAVISAAVTGRIDVRGAA